MNALRRASRFLGVPARGLLVGAIHVYRRTLSGVLGGQCRFSPSCSHYAEQAIREHGAVRGVALAAWRIARCGPFTRGGVDRVPPRGHGAPSYRGVYDGVAPAGRYDKVTRARSNRGTRRSARNSHQGVKA